MKTTLYIFFVLVVFLGGNLSAQKTKKNDDINGHKVEYYPNGKISKDYNVENGQINGEYKSYSEDGILQSVMYLKNGIQDGIQKNFFKNGQIQSEMEYKDGLPQGMTKQYYENGTLKTESYLTVDAWEYSGTTKNYYEEGTLSSEGEIVKGKVVHSIKYDKQGRITFDDSEGNNISYTYDNLGIKHTSVNGQPCQCPVCK